MLAIYQVEKNAWHYKYLLFKICYFHKKLALLHSLCGFNQ